MQWRETLIGLISQAATRGGRLRIVLTAVGGSLFLGVLALTVGLPLLLDRLLDLPVLCLRPWSRLIAIPLLATGFWLWAWSLATFLKARGTPVPFNPPPQLVTAGPYSHVRNPMLLGVFLLLEGFGVASQSVALTCVFGPLFILLNLAELKWIEEPELERRLGPAYLDYRRRVPMFFPRWKMRARP